jgi:ankyrin repeat protein
VSLFYDQDDLVPLGQADSLYEAIDNFSDLLVQDEYYGNKTNEPSWLYEALGEQLANIASFKRRLLIYWSLGGLSPMAGIDDDDHSSQEACIDGAYVSGAVHFYPKSRYVVAWGAAPPNHEEGGCIIELATKVNPVEECKALFRACSEGNIEGVKEQLQQGISINIVDEEGNTALHVAVAYRQLAVVNLLLKAGANPNAQRLYQHVPLFATLSSNHKIEPLGKKIDDENHFDIIKTLLAHGADITAKRLHGETILEMAMSTVPYPKDWIQFLLDKGSVPLLAQEEQPVHWCITLSEYDDVKGYEHEFVNQIHCLLQYGVSPNTKNRDSRTALHCLLKSYRYSQPTADLQELVDIVKLMVAYGAHDYNKDSFWQGAIRQLVKDTAAYKPIESTLLDLIKEKEEEG